MADRTCLDCSSPISRESKGRCRKCAMRIVNADPALIAIRNEHTRIKRLDPVVRARHADATRAGKRRSMERPEEAERLRRSGLEIGRKNFWRNGDAATQANARAAIQRSHLTWCPERYWSLNAELKRKHLTLAERKRVIAAEVAREERERLAALTPFQRQMEQAARVGIVEKQDFRTGGPAMTLGGVASGML